MSESIGAFSQLGINSTKLCFSQFHDDSVHQLVDPNGDLMCGGLDDHSELVTDGIKDLRFRIVGSPTPEEANVILPLCGFSEDTDVFTPTTSLTAFTTTVDRVADILVLSNCYVDKLIVRGQVGRKPWTWELHCVAKTGATTGSFTPTAPTKTAPYAFHEGVLKLVDTTEYQFDRHVLMVNNNVAVSFNNSTTANDIQITHREVILGVTTPYNSAASTLHATLIGSTRAAGITGTLQYVRSGISSSIAFANLKTETRPPSILTRGPIKYDLYFKGYRTSSTDSITWTHDVTA